MSKTEPSSFRLRKLSQRRANAATTVPDKRVPQQLMEISKLVWEKHVEVPTV